MDYLNKHNIIIGFFLISFAIVSCERYSNFNESDLLKYNGIYTFGMNDNSFTSRFDKSKTMKMYHLYNCAEINSKSKTLTVQMTMNKESLVFNIKKKDDNTWSLLIDNEVLEAKPSDFDSNQEILLSYLDSKNRKTGTALRLSAYKTLNQCIEERNAIYESEEQFVKEQNNDGEK